VEKRESRFVHATVAVAVAVVATIKILRYSDAIGLSVDGFERCIRMA
jgi:hypothetical protein